MHRSTYTIQLPVSFFIVELIEFCLHVTDEFWKLTDGSDDKKRKPLEIYKGFSSQI